MLNIKKYQTQTALCRSNGTPNSERSEAKTWTQHKFHTALHSATACPITNRTELGCHCLRRHDRPAGPTSHHAEARLVDSPHKHHSEPHCLVNKTRPPPFLATKRQAPFVACARRRFLSHRKLALRCSSLLTKVATAQLGQLRRPAESANPTSCSNRPSSPRAAAQPTRPRNGADLSRSTSCPAQLTSSGLGVIRNKQQ